MRKILCSIAVILLFSVCANAEKGLKLLYWNIQNGMWCGQNDNYEAFTNWVKAQNPDICVWCEAQSIYLSGSDKAMPEDERYLVKNWGELAASYGHKYWAIGGYRDSYPQVITSKYPIKTVSAIIGNEADSVVVHGAGWFSIERKGKTVNIVSLHTWPQKYGYQVSDREASKANNEGDRYRRKEIEYICKHTIGTLPNSSTGLWMMMGDFNATSRKDNWHYKYPEDDTRFLVHDYILSDTPYIDVIGQWYCNKFIPTTGSGRRIDFIYCSPELNKKVSAASVISDSYTEPVREPNKLSNFWIPSDHKPIIVVFDL